MNINGVLNLVKKIPEGRVASYKEIAKKLKIHPRAVASALKQNPHPIEIPCHRVVHASREIGGYKLGREKKIELLRKEGVKIRNNKIPAEFFISL